MQRFFTTLQFLTRITVIKNPEYDEDFKKGIIYFPIVGLVLGLILAVFYKGFTYFFPNTVTSILVVAIYLGLTGGLHLDGLADTFDGFYSSRTRDEILVIMKDSRLGSNGVIVILISILLKVFLITNFSENTGFLVLILMPMMGRLAAVHGSYNINYAREKGLGNIYIGNITREEMVYANIIAMIICLIDIRAIPFILILGIFSMIFKDHSKNIIGGMTGDTLGALSELTEIIFLLYMTVV
ncbi:MAG: adenosylcobinamide-GDP ribazoletransferase [Clostridiales bacterium]|nr:adenosylcobinamide-GDP ribazoletransferase [Clostridiales bacterium]